MRQTGGVFTVLEQVRFFGRLGEVLLGSTVFINFFIQRKKQIRNSRLALNTHTRSWTPLKRSKVLLLLTWWAAVHCLITIREGETVRRRRGGRREGGKKAEAAVSVSSAAFNWNGTKKKIEVVQQTDFNPFSVLQFRHSLLFPLIGQRQWLVPGGRRFFD